MKNSENLRFFLGANSPDGFYSRYDSLIDRAGDNRVFIIKGSAGCGKSTFMRRVERRVLEHGGVAEEILCSSDPDSLDGVIFPELGVALVDGTAPHVVEPIYPGVVDRYVNLGDFWDPAGIETEKEHIVKLVDSLRDGYAVTYRLLHAAKQLSDEVYHIGLGAVDLEKLARRARGIASREIRKKGSGGIHRDRFLTGISNQGIQTLWGSVDAICDRVIGVEDEFGLSHFFLSPIATAARSADYACIFCYDPQYPASKLSHLLIPELRLGFVSFDKDEKVPLQLSRKVHLSSCIDREKRLQKQKKFRFCKRTRSEILSQAVDNLKATKQLHDELEKCYSPHMDFEGVNKRADALAEYILR